MSEAKIIHGDNRETLAALPERHFHCCVTSPPYWGLRDYGVDGQIGLEGSPEGFVAAMVDVFRGVWRVLRDDGVLWLNLGDSYCSTDKWGGGGANTGKQTIEWTHGDANCDHVPVDDPNSPFNCQCVTCAKCDGSGRVASWAVRIKKEKIEGVKPKDLVGIPWRVAFALQEGGWYLRDAIIWHKPAPMPGSQQDRCTSAYEFIFQLTKSPRYFFDMEAIKTPMAKPLVVKVPDGWDEGPGSHGTIHREGRSKGRPAATVISTSTPRNVWTMASGGCKEAHFATFPIELPLRCIKASTSSKGCCSGCGAQWQRITERTALKRERPNELTKRTGEDGTGNHCANTVAGVEARTIGWEPTCDCGRCHDCGLVIEYGNVQHHTSCLPDVREELPGQASSSVLQQEMSAASVDSAEALPGVRQEVQAKSKQRKAVRQNVRCEVDGEESQVIEGRTDSIKSRLCADLDAGSSECDEQELCDGTSLGDGKAPQAISDKERDSSSQGRRQAEQSAEQSYPDGQARTRQTASPHIPRQVPVLWNGVSGEGQCPRCRGRFVAAEVVPARVIDPFSGAGTTAVACRRLGIDYVGCELNQEYIDMSLRRIAKEANRDSKMKPVKVAAGQAELF